MIYYIFLERETESKLKDIFKIFFSGVKNIQS